MGGKLKIEGMVMMMMMLVGFGMIATCHAQSASNVYTTYNIYNPKDTGYSLTGLYCDTQYGSQSYAWRSAFPWTAFCGPIGPDIDQACGQCLMVTNPSTGQSVKVRIVDQCSNGGLDLDQTPFNDIDGNGQGYDQGHMYTTYTFVACNGEETKLVS